MSKTQIEFSSVTKYYDSNTRALNNIDLNISKGQWASIIGPSGSGKTTLLNLIGCLDKPTSGDIVINESKLNTMSQKELTQFRRENIGLIFQQYHLIPYLTSLENVMIAQYFYGVIDKEAATEALENVGLSHRLTHRPSQLSGGEQQRVCVARALINKPNIILADEPTGNLDSKNGQIIMSILKELNDLGHTLVLITHNTSIANQAERIIKMFDGEILNDQSNTPNKSIQTRARLTRALDTLRGCD
ncbi:ABC transporter ATP-binding protein [[Eubacterium] cellulosolvens]